MAPPMAHGEVLSSLRAAADSLRRVRLRLADPGGAAADAFEENLECAGVLLARLAAPGELERFRSDAVLCRAAADVHRELIMINALVRQAHAFCTWWLGAAGLLTGGYTAAGEPTSVRLKPRLRVNA